MESDNSSCSKILSNDGKHLIFQLEAFSPDRQAIFHAFRMDCSASFSLFSSALIAACSCHVLNVEKISSVFMACSVARSMYFSASCSCLILK